MKTLNLKIYASINSAFLAAAVSHAQVIYTDVDPDIVFDLGVYEDFNLDMNADGIDDFYFRFHQWFTSDVTLEIYALNDNSFAYYTGAHSAFCPWGDEMDTILKVKAIDSGTVIGSGLTFTQQTAYLALSRNGGICSDFYVTEPFASESYIGVKLKIDSAEYFGWIRFITDIYSGTTATLYDYALETKPGIAINAGSKLSNYITSSAKELVLADVGNSGTANDLQITFAQAEPEDLIDAYHIFLVPETAASEITLEEALSVSDDYLISILPTGNDISISFDTNTKDYEGNALFADTSYIAFVISKSSAAVSSLSEPSNAASFHHSSTALEEENINEITIAYNDGLLTLNSNDIKSIERIQIFDINGNSVFESHHPSENMKLPPLAEGIYFIQAYFEGVEKKNACFSQKIKL